ncbi:MAG: oxidoreductase [Alphaproteobacteria bacterium]
MTLCARLALFGAVLLGVSAAAQAESDRGLEVVGLAGGTVSLDLDQIESMGSTRLETTTVWTDGQQSFVGVTGADFVAAIGASGEAVLTHAINDYEVVIPFAVFAAETTLIAYRRNGEPMSVRDKGPLWIVFPFDADAMFQSDTYRSYAIWNLDRVEFR